MHTQRAQSLGHTLAAAGGAPVQLLSWKQALKYGALGTLGAAVGFATAPAWIGAGLGIAGGAALGLGASGLHDLYTGSGAEPERKGKAQAKRKGKAQAKSKGKAQTKRKPKPQPKKIEPPQIQDDSSPDENEIEPVASSSFNPSPSDQLDFLDEPSKQSKRRQRKREKREREREEEQRQLEAALQRALDNTRKLPRHVIRYDRNFTATTNRSGQGKAHRVGSDLVPAGTTAVTAVEQLHQDSPNKGTADRISFAGLKAANAQDYSAGGTRSSVLFKFRKAHRAQLKKKDDATGFRALSAKQVLNEVRGDKSAYGHAHREAAKAYATKDNEHQAVGTIPARFLKWSDDSSDSETDSDSDDEITDDEK
ncbi:hypothetical protein WMF04_12255 [Sorangium sp. So ce260]|uniref:hypothetical protein n=1 Tax=Sorangium sp. So ce260 TaxID=3133291 RepID=UPI003F5E04B6